MHPFLNSWVNFTYLPIQIFLCAAINIYKVKLSYCRPRVAHRLGRVIALILHDCGTGGGEWSAARPGRNLPPEKTRYQFYRRLGGPQGWSGRAENLILTGIRSRNVQPLVSTRPTYIYDILQTMEISKGIFDIQQWTVSNIILIRDHGKIGVLPLISIFLLFWGFILFNDVADVRDQLQIN